MKVREKLDYLMTEKGPEPESPENEYKAYCNKHLGQIAYQEHMDKSLSNWVLKDKTNHYLDHDSFNTQSSIARNPDQSSTPSDQAIEEIFDDRVAIKKKARRVKASG